VTTQPHLRFVALGDSTTVGIGDPAAATGWRGWSRLLAAELARTHSLAYTNLAVSGATAGTVRAGQLPPALRLRPHIASVIVGMNDTMRSTWDPGRIRDDILGSVAALSQAGALVLSVRFHDHGTVFRLPRMLRRPLLRRIEVVNAAYDAAHAAHGGVQLDLTVAAAVRELAFWSVDRLHPNERGHRWLASEFALALRTRGYVLGCPTTDVYHTPSRWQEYRWLLFEGLPWLCRRANDLIPWAVRMAAVEAMAQQRAAQAETTSLPAQTWRKGDTPPQAITTSPSVHPASSA
jgi:lysophospholipase L1-like esterase